MGRHHSLVSSMQQIAVFYDAEVCPWFHSNPPAFEVTAVPRGAEVEALLRTEIDAA